jgi:glyoxylase-like metal-dependent hydrolase (beta-lactamase superfamily II)
MKTTRITHDLFHLTRFPRLFPVNAYLVRESDGFTLIDTAISGSTSAIVAAAQQLGTPIVRIVLTHAHADHVGSLDPLHQALPNAQVLMSERTAQLLQGNRSLEAGEPGKLRGSWKTCATRPDRLIAPGDRIGSLQVIASPGHTPDHVSFLDTRGNHLIAGDAFQTRAGVAVSGTIVPLFLFPGMATWDKQTALASAIALRALLPTLLAVGHGDVLLDPLPAMDRAIATSQRSLPLTAPHAG